MARRIQSVPGFDPSDSSMVWEAINALRGKLPAMTKFARMITGNEKLTVDITTSVPYTKGNKVFIRPPLGLGSRKEHERSACGSRGSGGKQICPACQIREVVDFYLFHELAHVIGQTQAIVTSKEVKRARLEALRLHPQGCEHHDSTMSRLEYLRQMGCDAMTLGQAFNPWLPMMINSLEDSRVNALTFSSRPGMRTIFNMNLERLLTEGSEIGDGKIATWIDAPLDSQFIVGLQVAASGFEFRGEFAPEVMTALADPQLVRLCLRATQSTDVFQIFTLCLEVHERAQELGFCKLDPCVVAPPKPDLGSLGHPDEEDEGGGGSGESEQPPEGGESDREGGSGSGGTSGEGHEPNEADESDAEPSGSSDDPASGEGDSAAPAPSEPDSVEADDASESDRPGDEGEAGSPGDRPDGGRGNGSDQSESGSGGPEPDEGAGSDHQEPEGESGSDAGEASSGHGEHEAEAGDDSSKDESGGVEGDQTPGSGSGEVPPHGDDESPGAATDAPDDAGSSRSDSQGRVGPAASERDPQSDVRELEGSVRDGGSEQVVPDSSDVAHESRDGREPVSSAGDEGRGLDSVEPGEGDATGGHDEANLEGDAEPTDSNDQDLTTADRVENPWDVPHDELADVDAAPFDAPSVAVGDPTPVVPQHGTPDDAARALSRFLMHGHDESIGLLDEMAAPEDGEPTANTLENLVGVPVDDQAYDELVDILVNLAITQVGMFDQPSATVVATEMAKFPMRGIRWSPRDTEELQSFTYDELTTAFAPSEELMGSVVLHGRIAFDANKRSHLDRNRKSGKVNTRVLGRRAPVGDDRLFAKKIVPKKRDYFVILGGDASASTSREERNAKIKRCIHAQGELLHRLNVPWAGYMHSAYFSSLLDFNVGSRKTGPEGNLLIWNYLLPFKEANDQWNDEAKIRLASINHVSQNLDGHTLEAYRKLAMKSTATDRVVIYYTDGEMPAENKEEETAILLREIELYKKYGIHLVCVAIQTDSPKKYGLPTVRVDRDEDIIKVVRFLDEILTKR